MSTTQLTAVTGQGLGSMGRHLRILREAGLVERRRAGRSVLYARTPAGDVLMQAAGRRDAGPGTTRPATTGPRTADARAGAAGGAHSIRA